MFIKKQIVSIIGVIIAVIVFIVGFGTYKKSLNPANHNIQNQSDKVKIALVTDTLVGNNLFIIQAYNELLELSNEYDIDAFHLEAVDTYTWTEGTRDLCVEGYSLIIGLGWQATTSFANLSSEYPDVQFTVIDTAGEGENVRGILYESTDGCFTLGAMMAKAFPDENLFGYIGNYKDVGNFAYETGFRQGVLSVNPEAEFIIEFANTYSDIDLVREASYKVIEQGASVIMGSVSSSANWGLYDVCLELSKEGQNVYATGLSIDQTTEENPNIIAGVTKDTALPVRISVEQFLEGTYESKDMILGLSDGGFGVVHLNNINANYNNKSIITDEVIDFGQEVFNNLNSGKLVYEQEVFE
ncbi:MAG: BMP family ABC transporter substrate-binding protein [bacterium]